MAVSGEIGAIFKNENADPHFWRPAIRLVVMKSINASGGCRYRRFFANFIFEYHRCGPMGVATNAPCGRIGK